MAIKSTTEVLGFTTEDYVKIKSSSFMETGDDGKYKLYEATVGVIFYTNNTKEWEYKTQNFRFQGLYENTLSLEGLYTELMKLSEFENYTKA